MWFVLIGYYATVLTIEILGRKWIQIQGFLMAALFCTSLSLSPRSLPYIELTLFGGIVVGILAGLFETLSKVQFIVCFAFLQFFFNFGANA